MKKTAFLLLVSLFGCSDPDSQVSKCQQYCRDVQGEKCYDNSTEGFSPGDTDTEAGCGRRIEDCLNNCQKDSEEK